MNMHRTFAPTLSALLWIGLAALASAQQQPEPVAARLRTGLLNLNPTETMSVVVADVADASPGADITIRFIDAKDDELARTDGYLLPGQPLEAKLVRDEHPTGEDRLLVRLEIVMTAEQAGAEPIANVGRGFEDTFTNGWSCAWPPAERGPDYEYIQECPGARIDDLLAP